MYPLKDFKKPSNRHILALSCGDFAPIFLR